MMKMNKLVSITVSEEQLEEMKEVYSSFVVKNTGEYVAFEAHVDDLVITAYSSKKNKHKVVFTGESCLKEAKRWDETAEIKEPKGTIKKEWICFDDQIGSDEVGVGDFLGPMIVVAAFVGKKDIKKLKELHIDDSKKMSDQQILEVGPKVVKEFKFSKLTLSNEKYNEMYLKSENINTMKAKMHNRALLNMHKEYPDVLNIFVDQFVEEKTYYKYLNDENEEQVKSICFRTKGESYFPCVALASVIARYSYLLEMDKLSKKYNMTFPFGASEKVTRFAKAFVKKYGVEEFDKVAKKNFANYSEVISE